MVNTEEWKEAYYQSKSRKKLFIILAALIVAVNTGFIFMFLEKKRAN
jgi:hypothetical protein